MSQKIIQQLISGQYIADGNAVHVPVKSVRIEAALLGHVADLIAECGLKGQGLVVSDENTHIVAGAKIAATLGVSSLILKNGVKADIENVDKIKEAAKSMDYIVAVGSGTINDLCKYASFQLGIPYVVFGTAPSMNGYGSANSSITISGHKKTLKAHLPTGIFLDLDILVKAPVRLIRSGLGDSICRGTAQADWLMSHLLLGTYYSEVPFELLRIHEKELFDNASTLVKGDVEIMELLAITLVLSGFGMYIAGGSYPASQGEHMIAHTMEMAYGDSLPQSYHGEQISVTTLTMAKLQEGVLRHDVSLLLVNYNAMTQISRNDNPLNLSPEIMQECLSDYAAKQFSPAKLQEINSKLLNNWNSIQEQVSAVMLPHDYIYKVLKSAGCPLEPEDIDWRASQYNEVVRFAKYTRDRFTFLDLATFS